MQAISGRALHGYVSLAWDRNDAGADAASIQMHDELVRRLIAADMLPYRLGLPTIDRLPAAGDDWMAAMRRIRHALDPNGILAPGRIPGLD